MLVFRGILDSVYSFIFQMNESFVHFVKVVFVKDSYFVKENNNNIFHTIKIDI